MSDSHEDRDETASPHEDSPSGSELNKGGGAPDPSVTPDGPERSHASSSTAGIPDNIPVTGSPGATDDGATADTADRFDIDDAFQRLAAELDDIPGFRNLQGSPAPLSGPRDWEGSSEIPIQDEFVPPDPEVDLQGDPARILGWVLLILGIATVIISIFFIAVIPRVVLGSGGAVALVGAALLLWRLPRERDDEWDDGARV